MGSKCGKIKIMISNLMIVIGRFSVVMENREKLGLLVSFLNWLLMIRLVLVFIRVIVFFRMDV